MAAFSTENLCLCWCVQTANIGMYIGHTHIHICKFKAKPLTAMLSSLPALGCLCTTQALKSSAGKSSSRLCIYQYNVSTG